MEVATQEIIWGQGQFKCTIRTSWRMIHSPLLTKMAPLEEKMLLRSSKEDITIVCLPQILHASIAKVLITLMELYWIRNSAKMKMGNTMRIRCNRCYSRSSGTRPRSRNSQEWRSESAHLQNNQELALDSKTVAKRYPSLLESALSISSNLRIMI